MDLIIKITIIIFLIITLLIFFKVTKKMGENYLEKKIVPTKTHNYDELLYELENQESVPIEDFEWKIPEI